MKKIVILLFAVTALLSFSCNKYCHCKRYIDGTLDKEYDGGNYVNESGVCADYNQVTEEDGVTTEVKCK